VANGIDIRLLGDKQLQRKLTNLELAVQKKIVRKALRAGAKPMLATAKAKVNVDTGALKANIKIKALKRSRRGSFGVQVTTPPREKLGIAADDPGYYPAILEYGSATNRAQPFLRPAFDDNRSRSLDVVKETIASGVRGAVR